MQLDYRHFVMKLERIAEIKPLPYQDHVVNYVKAYYIPEADLEQWVKIHEVFYFIFFHIQQASLILGRFGFYDMI